MTWAYRKGARSHKVSAEDASIEFTRIKEKHGALRASVLVEESRDESAPCHREFEWNDEKAAHGYRLTQARTLIRDVVFVEEKSSEPLQFYHVPDGGGGEGHYEFIECLVNVRSEYEAALGELLQKLESVDASVRRLLNAVDSDAASVVGEVGRTISGVREKLQNLRSGRESSGTTR